MAEQAAGTGLVDRVVQFAFLIRLASLLLVLLMPATEADRQATLFAIVFITITSAAGLLRTRDLTGRVAAHPLLLVVDVLVATLVAAFLGSQSPLVLYSLSTAVLIGILLRPAVAALELTILISCYVLVMVTQAPEVSAFDLLIVPMAYATVGALGGLSRRLHESAMAQQATARRAVEESARERERARLAREMHDSVAKSLHGIGLAAAALPTWVQNRPELAVEKARELQAAAEQAAQESRTILVALRADTDERTLAQQLRVLAHELTADGVRTRYEVEGIADCDHEVKRELVAIAGEAVENVRRHAHATHVSITCSATPDTITLGVRDDGRGFDQRATPDGHYGLVGMHERAEVIGADLTVASSPGGGTTVLVRAPRSLPKEIS